jgi:hypothetical protein
MIETAHSHDTRFCWNRFSILLLSIILALALGPFLERFNRIKMLTDILLSVILLSVVRTVTGKKSTLFIGLALAFPCLVLKWSSYLADTSSFGYWAEFFGALFTA